MFLGSCVFALVCSYPNLIAPPFLVSDNLAGLEMNIRLDSDYILLLFFLVSNAFIVLMALSGKNALCRNPSVEIGIETYA